MSSSPAKAPLPTIVDSRSAVQLRHVNEAGALRALTHPTRIALLEALTLHGPLTATAAAEHVGESPSSCSFHLRQLAKYGFVEDGGGGQGRRRPWKMASIGMTFSFSNVDAGSAAAAAGLRRMLRSRQLSRLADWWQSQGDYPQRWRDAQIDQEHLIWMTPEEMSVLAERLFDELTPLYRERLTDPAARPEGAVPVELLLFGYPMMPPGAADR